MPKPAKIIRVGAVQASIFHNKIVKDGKEITIPKVVLQVRFKDKTTGMWRSVSSLSPPDLPKAIIALQKAYEEILQSCVQLNCQLLVMGAIGSTDSPKILIGKVTEKVMRELPCSVVTAKSEDIIQLRLNTELADIETHFRQGNYLLRQGFAEEAINQFQLCLDVDVMYVPAWESLAVAHERLGHKAVALKCNKHARAIRKKLWKKKSKEK